MTVGMYPQRAGVSARKCNLDLTFRTDLLITFVSAALRSGQTTAKVEKLFAERFGGLRRSRNMHLSVLKCEVITEACDV